MLHDSPPSCIATLNKEDGAPLGSSSSRRSSAIRNFISIKKEHFQGTKTLHQISFRSLFSLSTTLTPSMVLIFLSTIWPASHQLYRNTFKDRYNFCAFSWKLCSCDVSNITAFFTCPVLTAAEVFLFNFLTCVVLIVLSD